MTKLALVGLAIAGCASTAQPRATPSVNLQHEANVTLDERQFVKPGAAGDMPTAGDAKDAANQQPKPEPQKPAAPKKPPPTAFHVQSC